MPEIEAFQQPSTKLHPSAKTATGKQNDNNNNHDDPTPEAAPGQQQPAYADDAKKSAKIKELRKLVENCDDFVRRADDLFLCRFLNCCDWNVEEAYQRMCKLFKLKYDHPEWFVDKPVSHYEDLLKRNIKFVLDKRDKKGRRIFVSRLGSLDINVTSATDLAHLDELWVEYMLNDLETQQNGIACLLDMSGYSLKSMRYLTPGNVRIGSMKADLLPVKHMEFHVVNSSILLNAAVAVLFPVLSKQIKESVHFHYTNWDSLHSHLGKEALPAEYGGTNGTGFKFVKLNRQILDMEGHYNNISRFGYELKTHADRSKYAKLFQNVDKLKSSNEFWRVNSILCINSKTHPSLIIALAGTPIPLKPKTRNVSQFDTLHL